MSIRCRTCCPAAGAGSKDTVYIKVDPRLVVEVRVDVATADGRWRHGLRYLRPRPDLDPAAVPHNLELDDNTD